MCFLLVYLSQIAGERLTGSSRVRATLVEFHAPFAERFMRVLSVVGGRIAEFLVIPRLVVGFVRGGLVRSRMFYSHDYSPFFFNKVYKDYIIISKKEDNVKH